MLPRVCAALLFCPIQEHTRHILLSGARIILFHRFFDDYTLKKRAKSIPMFYYIIRLFGFSPAIIRKTVPYDNNPITMKQL